MYSEYFKDIKKNEIVFSEGDHSHAMFYLESGRVAVYKNYGEENQIKLSEITGGFFGEMGLINDVPRSATVVALEDSYVEVISNVYLEDYLEAKPYMIEEVLRTITARIRDIDRSFVDACDCISEYVKEETAGNGISQETIDRMIVHAAKA